MSFNKFAIFFSTFLLFFFVTQNRTCCEIYGEVQSDAELLKGLADRGLFDSVEFFYKNESKKTDSTRVNKYAFAVSVVYSRTLQTLTSTDLTRAQSLQQLTDFESQFQNDMKKIQSDQQTTNSFSAELLELVRLQLQFAVAKYLCGNRIRIESEIAADNEVDQVIGESQKMLLTAIEQLKKIKTYLAAQQNPTFSDQINSLSNEVDLYLYLAEISHALTIAQDNNRYAEAVLKSEKLNTQAQQRGAVVQGRSLPPIPAPVYNKLGQVAASLDEWSKKKLEFYSRKFDLSNLKVPELLRDGYYLVLRARVELAACYRIMQKFDKSSAVLNSQELKLDLEGAMLPEDLRLRIAAERIRFLTAIANSATINNPAIKDAEKSAWDISNLSALSVSVSADNLDYCLAKLELGLFLAGRKNVTDSSTEFMIITDVLKVIRQMELKIPSSGYCAAVVISSNKITPSKINNTRFDAIRTTVLGELAQNKNDRDQIMEAVKLYELAGRVAEVAGDKETATKNIQYSISSLYKLLKQLEASRQNAAQISEQNQQYWNDRVFRCRLLVVKMLCGWAVRFVGERISVEWYQRGIDEATILFKAKQLKLDDYIAILSGYVLRWENASDCAAYRLRAANLLEFNGRFDEALTFLDKIPNNSDRAMEAVTAADRCFKQIYNKNKTNLNDDERINVTINELNWFRRRLRDDVSEWSEADAVTAIKMAERLFYRNGTPIFYWETVDDKLLRNVESALVEAADKCKTALPVTIARLKMMLIIAYNLQGNHVKSTELVKQIVDVQVQLLTELERLFLRRFEVEVLAVSGNVRDAVKLLGEMLATKPRNLMLLELKARILSQQDDDELLTDAVKTWGIIGAITKENSEQWWQAREQIINILIKQGNKTEANKIYKKLKLLHPELGNKTRKNRLEKIMIP